MLSESPMLNIVSFQTLLPEIQYILGDFLLPAQKGIIFQPSMD